MKNQNLLVRLAEDLHSSAAFLFTLANEFPESKPAGENESYPCTEACLHEHPVTWSVTVDARRMIDEQTADSSFRISQHCFVHARMKLHSDRRVFAYDVHVCCIESFRASS